MRINKSLITYIPASGAGSGTVTSVALSAPTGFTVSGSPVTSSGTLALAFTTGYGIPPLMTGNSGRFLTTNGTTMSWVNIAGTDVTGAALTEVDDTNVTMTLGGTPSTALLRSVSMTLGWAGQLAVSRGGTGANSLQGVLIGNLTAPVTAVTGIGGQLLRANPSTGVYEFFTPAYMSNPMTTLGDIIYGNAAGAPTRLAANGTANNMYLRSVSGGIPSWASIAGGDITGAALTEVDDTNVTCTLGGTPANALLRSVSLTFGWTGQLSVPRGGTGVATLTGVVIGNGTGVMTGVAGTSEQLLRRNTANTAYEFFTPTFLSNPMTTLGDIIYGNAAGAPARLGANATSSNLFLRSVSSGTPSWSAIGGGDVTGAAITTANDTNIQITASGNTTNALLRTLTLTAGWTGALSPGRGGTGASTITGVVIGNGIGTMVGVAGTADQLLRRNTANTAYEFFTPTYLSNPMTSLGDIIYGNAAGAPLRLGANATSTNKYLRSVNGGTPSWEEVPASISGSGTTGRLTKWTGTTTLGDSIVSESANALDVSASVASTLKIANFRNTNASGFISIGVDRSSSARYSFIEHSTAGTTDWYVGTAYNAGGGNTNYSIGTGINLSDAKFNILTTGQMKLNAYTSSLSFTGIVAGYLAFTSGGSIITTSAPGGVSGTQDYLAKFDSTGIAVGNSRIVDNGTNFLFNSASAYVTGLNLIGDIGMQSASGQASSLIMRSNQTPTSGTAIGIIDSYAITTGSTYQIGGGIEFRASQNWNSTSAGTNIFVQTAPDNTIAPADMFVFLSNGAVRFIGRTSNPLSPAAGTMYYNSSANNMRYYNGTSWVIF